MLLRVILFWLVSVAAYGQSLEKLKSPCGCEYVLITGLDLPKSTYKKRAVVVYNPKTDILKKNGRDCIKIVRKGDFMRVKRKAIKPTDLVYIIRNNQLFLTKINH